MRNKVIALGWKCARALLLKELLCAAGKRRANETNARAAAHYARLSAVLPTLSALSTLRAAMISESPRNTDLVNWRLRRSAMCRRRWIMLLCTSFFIELSMARNVC